jgi:hypothetical protein
LYILIKNQEKIQGVKFICIKGVKLLDKQQITDKYDSENLDKTTRQEQDKQMQYV